MSDFSLADKPIHFMGFGDLSGLTPVVKEMYKTLKAFSDGEGVVPALIKVPISFYVELNT